MPIPRRPSVALALAGLLAAGCARDRARITPTTTGSDLRHLPPGRMTPLPFPGSSLARRDPAPADPATIPAGADAGAAAGPQRAGGSVRR